MKCDGCHFGGAGQRLHQDRGQIHFGNTDTNDEPRRKEVTQLARIGFVQRVRHRAHHSKRFDYDATEVLDETRLDVP